MCALNIYRPRRCCAISKTVNYLLVMCFTWFMSAQFWRKRKAQGICHEPYANTIHALERSLLMVEKTWYFKDFSLWPPKAKVQVIPRTSFNEPKDCANAPFITSLCGSSIVTFLLCHNKWATIWNSHFSCRVFTKIYAGVITHRKYLSVIFLSVMRIPKKRNMPVYEKQYWINNSHVIVKNVWQALVVSLGIHAVQVCEIQLRWFTFVHESAILNNNVSTTEVSLRSGPCIALCLYLACINILKLSFKYTDKKPALNVWETRMG